MTLFGTYSTKDPTMKRVLETRLGRGGGWRPSLCIPTQPDLASWYPRSSSPRPIVCTWYRFSTLLLESWGLGGFQSGAGSIFLGGWILGTPDGALFPCTTNYSFGPLQLCFQTASGVSEPRRRDAHVFWTFRLYKDCGGAELEPVLAEATGACSELILY